MRQLYLTAAFLTFPESVLSVVVIFVFVLIIVLIFVLVVVLVVIVVLILVFVAIVFVSVIHFYHPVLLCAGRYFLYTVFILHTDVSDQCIYKLC